MLDLLSLPSRYISTYGPEKVAEIVGQRVAIVAMWQKRQKFPAEALQKLLVFDPAPIHEIKPLYETPALNGNLMILVPLAGNPEPKAMDCILKLYDKREMRYERFAFNNLSVSRNALAARWLRSTCEWAWWNDADMLHPAGDAEWFKREAELPDVPEVFAGVHAIFRALVHRKKIVSCAYVSRRKNAVPQFGGDNALLRAELKNGPKNKLIEVPWCGFGGVLTHRSVFEDIIKQQGEEIKMRPGGIGERFSYTYAFFHPTDVETCGDDVPMCQRAIRAGHKIHVDLAIHSAHIGDRPYTYKDLA
jgi:hypothetical protein